MSLASGPSAVTTWRHHSVSCGSAVQGWRRLLEYAQVRGVEACACAEGLRAIACRGLAACGCQSPAEAHTSRYRSSGGGGDRGPSTLEQAVRCRQCSHRLQSPAGQLPEARVLAAHRCGAALPRGGKVRVLSPDAAPLLCTCMFGTQSSRMASNLLALVRSQVPFASNVPRF